MYFHIPLDMHFDGRPVYVFIMVLDLFVEKMTDRSLAARSKFRAVNSLFVRAREYTLAPMVGAIVTSPPRVLPRAP